MRKALASGWKRGLDSLTMACGSHDVCVLLVTVRHMMDGWVTLTRE